MVLGCHEPSIYSVPSSFHVSAGDCWHMLNTKCGPASYEMATKHNIWAIFNIWYTHCIMVLFLFFVAWGLLPLDDLNVIVMKIGSVGKSAQRRPFRVCWGSRRWHLSRICDFWWGVCLSWIHLTLWPWDVARRCNSKGMILWQIAFISFISFSYGFKISRLASSSQTNWAVWSEEHLCVCFSCFRTTERQESSKHRCCTEFGRAKMQSFSQLTGWSKNCLASCCDHWQDHLYNSMMALDVLQKWLENHILEKMPRPEEPGTYSCSSESVWFPSEEIVVVRCKKHSKSLLCLWDGRKSHQAGKCFLWVTWCLPKMRGKAHMEPENEPFTVEACVINLLLSSNVQPFSYFGSRSQVFFRHALMRLVFLPCSELL